MGGLKLREVTRCLHSFALKDSGISQIGFNRGEWNCYEQYLDHFWPNKYHKLELQNDRTHIWVPFHHFNLEVVNPYFGCSEGRRL